MINQMHKIEDPPKPITLLLAATTGGHLTEGLKLFGNLDATHLVIFSERSTRTEGMENVYTCNRSSDGAVRSILGALCKALFVILKEKPRWVITTGAECGVGAILAAKILRRRTIFVETACRYRTRSKTAKILYHLADVFLVQHEDSLKLFGKKARFIGGLF